MTEKLEEYHNGFVTLSNLYYRRKQEDLPVYNIYYSKKLCKMVIDKPVYINELLKTKNPDEIAQMFEGVAAIEKEHEERYKALAENVKNKTAFVKSEACC